MSLEFRSADLAGVHVALFTPLRRDCAKNLRNSIDLEKAAVMIEDLVEAGVQGIVPIGTTGQSPTVTAQQHLDFIRFTIERVAGRVKVIAGAGSNCTRESIDMINEIQRIAAGTPCLCVTGYYNNPPQEGIRRHYETVVEETGAPLVLYNIPSRTANYMEPETIVALARHPKILGIKQGLNFVEPGKFRQDTETIIRETSGMDFAVMTGDDAWFADLLRMGGTGIIAAAGNIPEAARLFLEVHRRFLSGDPAGSKAAQDLLAPFIQWCFVRKNPIPLATLFGSPVFQPLVEVAETAGGAELVAEMKDWARRSAPSLVRWWPN